MSLILSYGIPHKAPLWRRPPMSIYAISESMSSDRNFCELCEQR